MDGEEACNTPTSSSFANTISPNNNVALRLISPTASGVPMYRCMSQDPLQSSTSTECVSVVSERLYEIIQFKSNIYLILCEKALATPLTSVNSSDICW